VIVLDTNVLSEVMRVASDSDVLRWLGDLPNASVYPTTITQAEILYGIRLLPAGNRHKNP